MPTSPLHQALRQATREAHHALDHHPVLAPLAQPTLTRADYGRALQGLHALHAYAEPAILGFLARHNLAFDYQPRCKLAALEQDLDALGLAPPDEAMRLDAVERPGQLIGLLYTVEGSTLGGHFLVRRIRQSHGDDLPTRFLGGYGDQTESRWSEFWCFANVYCPEAEMASAQTYAVATFTALKARLDRLI
ncbi:MAG: biliverdin-producing heme oxygenase [Rhodocyclaceae bacterium]|nr:biliverdin-producing heme oxygenase [Rhodocyclaceae bacterium]MDZ4214544.1 biliverdin-producing heme oxygenase [Rhodocyclaceae bacterium]